MKDHFFFHAGRHVLVFSLVVVVGCLAKTTETVSESQPTATTFSYGGYAQLLTSHVDESGHVDYAGLQQDKEKLDAFANQLATLNEATYEGWQHDVRFAFWINVYNALTLRAVADHYPVDSIKELGSPLRTVWDKLKFNVMGNKYTLNDIEHRVLRERFKDPRFHVAINCESIGCPPLSNKPYRANRLSQHFEKQTRQFLATDLAFRIDRENHVVYLSKIFDWFGDDFIELYGNALKKKGLNKKQNATIHFASQHLGQPEKSYLASETFRVKYLDYDWGLNKQ